MFGYVTINRKELSKEDLEKYKAYYCGLCDGLERKYGRRGISLLSYDMTFLYMLLSDLYNTNDRKEEKRCAVHPVGKHPYIVNELTEYVSDMQVLLSYFSLKDKSIDNDLLKDSKKLLALESIAINLRNTYPRQYDAVSSNYQKILSIEKLGDEDVNTLSSLSGDMVKEVFAPREDVFHDSLASIGKALGSFIYIMDAVDDLKKDIKHSHYNPLKTLSEKESFNADVKEMLELPLSQAAAGLERLPLDDNLAILRNIIYSGVWSRYEVLDRKRKT
ncbi:MAG: DUF5685 family protein [Bullifex sp.]